MVHLQRDVEENNKPCLTANPSPAAGQDAARVNPARRSPEMRDQPQLQEKLRTVPAWEKYSHLSMMPSERSSRRPSWRVCSHLPRRNMARNDQSTRRPTNRTPWPTSNCTSDPSAPRSRQLRINSMQC